MNEDLKEILISTLNVAEGYYKNINKQFNKYDFLEDVLRESSLSMEAEELEEVLKDELGWY